ncbi:hypothetical protein Z043_125349, partial [Scleropages formosus]
ALQPGNAVEEAEDSRTLVLLCARVVNALPEEKIQEVRKAIRLFLMSQGPARTLEEAGRRSYLFWDTQPVPKIGETVTSHCCVVPDPSSVREEPLSLPPGFAWDSLDLEHPDSLKELHVLLSENYEEDDDGGFRLAYSPQFLLWSHGLLLPSFPPVCCPRALRPPGWLPQQKKMAEVKLLCVHKKLRKKRLAPVLIREITRRAHLEGVFQGVYAAGVVLPKPVATCRFWHRYLNPRKLIEVKFSHLNKNMTVQRALKLYRLPEVSEYDAPFWLHPAPAARCAGLSGGSSGSSAISSYHSTCRH